MTARHKLLTVDEIQGAWAIIPTPATPDASHWQSTDTVDLVETSNAVRRLVEAGVDGILSLGTLGECATLTREEKRKFIATAVEATGGRVPFFAGTTALNTRESIEQTREAYDLGARGTLLGLPMWCANDLTSTIKFYRDVVEACPEMAICVYANAAAFKFPFGADFWAHACEIPQIVSAKYPTASTLLNDLAACKNRIRLMPIDADYTKAARLAPEHATAFWSSGTVCGPTLSTRLRDLVSQAKINGDWQRAEDLSSAIGKAMWPLIPNGDLSEFNKYNIGLEKERMNAAGWMKAGPCRPPYTYVPGKYLDSARNAGRLWAKLEQDLLQNPNLF